jgi:hypothetical protein
MTVGAIFMQSGLPRALVPLGVVVFSLAVGGYIFPGRPSGGQHEHLAAGKDSANE